MMHEQYKEEHKYTNYDGHLCPICKEGSAVFVNKISVNGMYVCNKCYHKYSQEAWATFCYGHEYPELNRKHLEKT